MRRLRWLERLLLSPFAAQEREEIVSDLEELSMERRGVRRHLYYWVELAKYPLRNGWDVVRGGRGTGTENSGGVGMGAMIYDLRYTVRALRKSAGFTVMTIAIMTVSMGAATAIFSVVDGVLLQPLPLEAPDRLMSIWLEDDEANRARVTPGNVRDVSELREVFSGVAAFGTQATSLAVGAEQVFLRGSRVTPGYFATLGVSPVVGRGFTSEEGLLDGPSVVVLSHRIWTEMFGADPAVTRRSVELDGTFFQVVGVAPPGVYPTHATVSAELPFSASNQDFFVPLRYSEGGWSNRRSHLLGVVARLAPGMSREGATERVAALSSRLQSEGHPNSSEHLLMTSFAEEVVGDVRFGLWTLLATVGLVLIIAMVNVGSLFVLRADDRQPLLAIRAALGAPRSRLLREMALESLLISLVSSLGAIGMAHLILQVMKGLVPYQIPRLSDVSVDATALGMTLVLGLLVAVVFGVAPAGRLRDTRLSQGVGRMRSTGDTRSRHLQAGVLSVQAALCVVVLVAAGLLMRSYGELRAVDTGFGAADAWTMSVPAAPGVLPEIVEGVRALPGVASAAIAYDHPLERNWGDGFRIEGVVRTDADPPMGGSLRPFGEGYFETVRIGVVEGRVPDALDMSGEVAYAVVNESLAAAYFDGRSPIGARIVLPTAQRMTGGDGGFEVLGVVRDVRFLGPDQPASPALYVPLSHFPATASTLLVLPERDDVQVVAGVRAVAAGIDPTVAVQQAQRLGDILDDLLARPRFNMMLLVTFGLVGLVLSGLGAYGLVSRAVSIRRREIGVQMALGADRSRLARSVLAMALRPMVLGGLVGVTLALGLTRTIRSLLFGVSPLDPAAFGASAVFVLLIGVVAALLPTLRAVSIDPAATLRGE